MNRKKAYITGLFIIVIMFFFIGCGEKAKEEEKIIKIGATFPLSGEVASAGERIKNALLLALDEVNIEGVSGKKIKIIFEDDQNKPSLAAGNMKKFVDIDNVVAVIGSAASSCSLAMVPIANKKGIVMLSPISSSPHLTEKGGEYFFRICPSDDSQARVAAKWLIDKSVKSIAIVYVNNDWGRPLADSVNKLLKNNEIIIPVMEAINEGEKDLRAILTKIKNSNVDFVYAPTYPIDGGILVRQAIELNLNIRMLGGDNWNSEEFKSSAGGAINGCFFVSSIKYESEIYQQFKNSFKARYNENPDIFASWSYDAMRVMALALVKTKGKGGDLLRQVMHNLVFNGTSGKIVFDENGDQKYPSFGVFKYENNKKYLIKGD